MRIIVDIKDFIKTVGQLIGKNILVDGDVRGKVTFYMNNGKDLRKEDLIPLLNAILETKKMTLINQGGYYEVVKSTEASGKGLPVRHNRVKSNEGTMQTVIFRLNKANAAVMRTKIKPLLPKSAKVISFKDNNLLSITAYPRTLKSIKKIINSIENSEEKSTEIVPLDNAYVKNIFLNIQTMARTIFPQDIASERVTVMKDDSSNSIILIGKRAILQSLNRISGTIYDCYWGKNARFAQRNGACLSLLLKTLSMVCNDLGGNRHF